VKIFIKFTSKIFKQWIIYLGLIPTVYDLLSAYLDLNYKFPQWVIFGFPIIILLYAIYQVYRDEYLKRIKLEKKLEGPTNYKITANLYSIDYEKDEKIKQLEDIKIEAEKKLASIPLDMEVNEVEKYLQVSRVMSVPTGFNNKSASAYNSELSLYKLNLEDIALNIETYKDKINAKINELSDTFYFIEFYIENVGITSDSEIQVDLNCLNDNIVFPEAKILSHGMDLYKLIPQMPSTPEKPKIQSPYDDMNNRLMHASIFDFDIPDPNAFRKWVEINEDSCSLTIRDLQVGDKINLFKQKLIFMKNTDDISFTVTIKSKESTKILKPKVTVDINQTTKTLFNYGDN